VIEGERERFQRERGRERERFQRERGRERERVKAPVRTPEMSTRENVSVAGC